MVSYRKLAMRVVGKPLHAPASASRPAAHRATALVLSVALAAALSAPAFAGYTIDMSDTSRVTGDVTIEKKDDGTVTIRIGDDETDRSDQFRNDNEGDDITITGSNAGKGADDPDDQSDANNTGPVTQESRDESSAVVTDENTSEDITDPEPAPVVTWPDENADSENEEVADKTLEDTEKTEEKPVEEESGEQTRPAETILATLEAPAPAALVDTGSKSRDDDSDAVTYKSNSFTQKVADSFSHAANYVIRIINNMKNTEDKGGNKADHSLNVTLDGVTVDAAGRDSAALTVSGSGDTTLNLRGKNTLTGGGEAQAGLSQVYSDSGDLPGTLTITGGANDRLTATGSSGEYGGRGISCDGDLMISGGIIEAVCGKGATDDGDIGISGGNVTIKGGTVTASGRNSNIYSEGSLTISGKDTRVTALGGYSGLSSMGKTTIEGGTINASGDCDGGCGISSYGGLTISGGDVTATAEGEEGQGIFSLGDIFIEDGTVKASSKNSNGILGVGGISISGGNVTAEGGGSGHGIHVTELNSSTCDLTISGNATVTAKAGRGGHALAKATYNERETGEADLDPATVVSENAHLVTMDADGNILYSNLPRAAETAVAPASGSSTASTTDSSVPEVQEPVVTAPEGVTGIDFSGMLGGSVSVNIEVNGSTMEFAAPRYGAAMRTTLARLRELKARGLTHVTFHTMFCTTTISIDDLLLLGGDATEVVLKHTGTRAKLTVGGVETSILRQ